MGPHLPLWAQWIQAIGTPALAIVLTGFGIKIAWDQAATAARQERIARERVRHDLYDRRYGIYLAFQQMLTASLRAESTINDDLEKAGIAGAQAHFLLNDEVAAYLEKLHSLAFRYHHTKPLFNESNGFSGQERFDMANNQSNDAKELLKAMPKLSKAFLPFLKLDDLKQ